jgi:hypothetical protein
MIDDQLQYEVGLHHEKESMKRKLAAGLCAVALTGILVVGYGYFRTRHAKQVLVNSSPAESAESLPKGPPQAHIVIDEPLLEKGTTTLRGSVKNISTHELTGLSIAMELRRRQDGATEEAVVPVAPPDVQPGEDGSYSIKLDAQKYGSIRLVGLTASPQSTPIPYTSSPGKKRPPEKLEPKTVVIKRTGRSGEFLNTPDNPTRVP